MLSRNQHFTKFKYYATHLPCQLIGYGLAFSRKRPIIKPINKVFYTRTRAVFASMEFVVQHSTVLRFLLMFACSLPTYSSAIIKDPLIDGFVGLKLQENQVIITLILSQDSYLILDAISKQEVDMEIEEA